MLKKQLIQAWVVAAVLSVVAQGQANTDSPPTKKRSRISKEEARRLLEEEKEKAFSQIVPRSLKPKRYLRGYRVIVSDHFIIFTNGPRTTLRFKTTLEKLFKFIKKYYPYADETKQLKCYIFKSKEEYFDYSEKIREFRGARASAGHATSEYYATFYQAPAAAVVIHEATHLIVGAVCKVRGGGSWFQEGTAVFMENLFLGQDPSVGQRSKVRYGRFYPLREFAAIRTLAADGKNASRNYAQAGSLMDFMVRGPLKEKFKDYMEYLRKNPFTFGAKGAEKSIRDVYGMSLEEFDEAWMRYVGYKPKKKRKKT
jgi:hypothetical protein